MLKSYQFKTIRLFQGIAYYLSEFTVSFINTLLLAFKVYCKVPTKIYYKSTPLSFLNLSRFKKEFYLTHAFFMTLDHLLTIIFNKVYKDYSNQLKIKSKLRGYHRT